MAATKRNAMLIEEAREKIKTTQLINRLQDHALGTVEMSKSQVTATAVLLKKCIPDLQAVTIGGDEENPVTLVIGGLGASVDGKLARLISGATDDAAKSTDG